MLKKRDVEIPKEVNIWLEESLKNVPRNKPIDYSSDLFFKADTAHLRGYIKGYDPRFGFATGNTIHE